MTICFISHSTKDQAFVECELLDLLTALNVKPWYAKQHMRSASDWEPQIRKALEGSNWFLLVASPSAASSDWVKEELHWAMQKLPGRVIPVLAETTPLCDLHARLPALQVIDFREGNSSGRTELIRLLVHNSMRRSALEGNWRGCAQQGVSPWGPIQLTVTASFTFIGSVPTGSFRIAFPTPDGTMEMDFDSSCDIYFDRFIQMNYRSKDPGMVEFGAIVLDLDELGTRLSGSYVGYGAHTKSVVSGTVTMTKAREHPEMWDVNGAQI